jgi:hypothetical protein
MILLSLRTVSSWEALSDEILSLVTTLLFLYFAGVSRNSVKALLSYLLISQLAFQQFQQNYK